jgi:hypothetical protein
VVVFANTKRRVEHLSKIFWEEAWRPPLPPSHPALSADDVPLAFGLKRPINTVAMSKKSST